MADGDSRTFEEKLAEKQKYIDRAMEPDVEVWRMGFWHGPKGALERLEKDGYQTDINMLFSDEGLQEIVGESLEKLGQYCGLDFLAVILYYAGLEDIEVIPYDPGIEQLINDSFKMYANKYGGVECSREDHYEMLTPGQYPGKGRDGLFGFDAFLHPRMFGTFLEEDGFHITELYNKIVKEKILTNMCREDDYLARGAGQILAELVNNVLAE